MAVGTPSTSTWCETRPFGSWALFHLSSTLDAVTCSTVNPLGPDGGLGGSVVTVRGALGVEALLLAS